MSNNWWNLFRTIFVVIVDSQTLVMNKKIIVASTVLTHLLFANVYSQGESIHFDFQGNPIELSVWSKDYAERCYFPKLQNHVTNNLTNRIELLLSHIATEAEIGEYLLLTVLQSNTVICLETMNGGNFGYYDYALNLISLNTSNNLLEQLIVLVHELRHVDLAYRGFKRTIDYDLYEMARLNAASEADAQAITVLFAWQMKSQGTSEVWNTLLELTDYADIASIFNDEMKAQGSIVEALRAAFIQWYKVPSRVEGYKYYATENYLSALEGADRLQSYRLLPRNYFYSFCLLSNGDTYKCELTQELQRPYGPF